MTRHLAAFTLLCIAPLAGCNGPQDPFHRPGTWSAIDANEANLRAMVSDPAHLRQGLSTGAGRGPTAAAAVDRLLGDRVKALPNVSTSSVGGGSAGQ